MSVDVLKATEGRPDQYPDAGMSDGALEAALWTRIEAYISHRWQSRPVAWTLCGSGAWTPPLTPTIVETVEVWRDGAYREIAASAGPLGYDFAPGTYRVTGTAGKDEAPPAEVIHAFNRLAGYLEDNISVSDSATRQSVDYGNGLSVSLSRPASWRGSALQHSGAADLLRRYRRA